MSLVIPNGKATGLLPSRGVFGDSCPLFADEIEVIPREHWAELIPQQPGLRPHVHHVFDQDGEGSCASESATGALQIIRTVAGQSFVKLNPWSVYAYTKIGGGGSTLDDNMRHLRDHGVAPMSIWPRSEGVRRLPADVAAIAKQYRLDEFYELGSELEAGTALLKGFPVAFGWNGHSCCFTRLLDDRGNAEYLNSWHESWGDQGFGRLNLREVYWGYRMFAYRTPIEAATQKD